jgi:Flp pilus assembly protein TadD
MWLVWALWLMADPARVFDAAVAALRAGQYEAAERGFQEVLSGQPAHVGALANLGVVYTRTERFGDAVTAYRKAWKVAPGDAMIAFNLGLAYFKQDNPAAAAEWFAAARQKQPSMTAARELLATCYVLARKPEPALRELEGLPASAAVLYVRAVAQFQAGQRDAADRTLDELLRTAATLAQGNFLLGKAYYDGGAFEMARTHLQKAKEQDAKLPGVGLELAKAFISLRQDGEAEAELREVLRADATLLDAAYYLGALLVKAGREEEALPLLERVVARRPDGWGGFYYLGRAHLQLGRAREAVARLERAAQLNPGEASTYFQLAKALRAVGRPEDARRAQEQFQKLQPRQPDGAAK